MALLLAFAALGLLRDEAALRSAFAKDFKAKDAAKRAEAVGRLSGSKEEESVKALLAGLKDPEKSVREATAKSLESCEDGAGLAIAPLAALLTSREEDPAVRLACAKAIAKAKYRHDPTDALIRTICSITPKDQDLYQFGADVTGVLNAFAGQDFGKGKTTPMLWEQWWEDHREQLKKDDAAARKAYEAGKRK
jgi:HEAT repeats